MSEDYLANIFRRVLGKSPIFRAREVLQHDYIPDRLPHRQKQVERLASTLAVVLKGECPSNIFMYGQTGTGKTAVVKYVTKHLLLKALEIGAPVIIDYINTRVCDTNYRVLVHLCETVQERVPFLGLPSDEVYERFKRKLDSMNKIMILILDEIDCLVRKSGDKVLYGLTRINTELENSRVCIVGVTNDLRFTDYLDPRVLSSLGQEEIVFPPYNASELADILEERARLAFNDGVLDGDVIPTIAAHAARQQGDARRALDLLRIAGEIAEREGAVRVTVRHVEKAIEVAEQDRTIQAVRTLPFQSKLILYGICTLVKEVEAGKRDRVTSGAVYDVYRSLCARLGFKPLTQRRVRDLLNNMEMLGIINSKIVSHGRYGRTRHISLECPVEQVIKLLKNDIWVNLD